MLKVHSQQQEQLARAMFIQKMQAAFSRDIPGFADLAEQDRKEFLDESMSAAEAIGLITEQGMASYALAVWWLGPDFETVSEELQALLGSSYPETRKVHAMNEWVHEMIGNPDDIAAADRKLKEAFGRTEAWGR
ncbi:hypothetical protein LPW11_05805 [Geomonas sp. RF6]|uniref:hypothetical protein n=1 Tax=Geomonas sp. RF6 TaxID=2897342 RepID=UPI001E5C35CF|nr:hypothetical protein [Geomonas sp. RF6]UFS71705.1 hypothetical protein LPW11_05805 [Geomonas sp. RF6]